MQHTVLQGVPPAAFGVEEDDFQRRKAAARPPVLDDSGPEFSRQDLKDPSEEFAPWRETFARIPETPPAWPMILALLAMWSLTFYALAYYLSH